MSNTRETAQRFGRAGIEMIAAMNVAPIVAILLGAAWHGDKVRAVLAAPIVLYGTGAALAALAMMLAFGSLRFLDRHETLAESGAYHEDIVADMDRSNALMIAAAGLAAGALVAFAFATFAIAYLVGA